MTTLYVEGLNFITFESFHRNVYQTCFQHVTVAISGHFFHSQKLRIYDSPFIYQTGEKYEWNNNPNEIQCNAKTTAQAILIQTNCSQTNLFTHP